MTEIYEFQYSSINNNTLPLEKYRFPPFLRIAKMRQKVSCPNYHLQYTKACLSHDYHLITPMTCQIFRNKVLFSVNIHKGVVCYYCQLMLVTINPTNS